MRARPAGRLFAVLIGAVAFTACDRPIEANLAAYVDELHAIAAQPPSFAAQGEAWLDNAQKRLGQLQLDIRFAASIARELDEFMDREPGGCIKTSFDISVFQKQIAPARSAVVAALNGLLSATDQRTQALEANATVSDSAGEREAEILQLGVLARDTGVTAIQGQVVFSRLAERAEVLSRIAAKCQ